MKDRVLDSHLSRWAELGSPNPDVITATKRRQLSTALEADVRFLGRKKQEFSATGLLEEDDVLGMVTRLALHDRLVPVFNLAVQRIQAQTNLFQPFEQLGLMGHIGNSFAIDSYAGYPVVWGALTSRGVGSFSVKEGIKIKDAKPQSPAALLAFLATDGLPDPVSSFVSHEAAHALQKPRALYPNYPRIAGELQEVYAYRSDGRFTYRTAERLKEHILTAKNDDNNELIYPYADPKKLNRALWVVDGMVALDFGPQQIAEVTSLHPEWDKHRQDFFKLGKMVLIAAVRKGLTRKDLALLVQADRVQKAITKQTARHLAQEVLLLAA